MSAIAFEFMKNKKYYIPNKPKKPLEDFYDVIDKTIDRNGHIGRISQKNCLHKSCSQCHGNGVKQDGSICVHYISCNCPSCTTYFM